MVELLKGIAVTIGQWNVLHQGQNGYRGSQGLRQRRHQKGRSGSVLRGDYPDPPADAGVAVGHCATSVLGPIGDLTDTVRGRRQKQRRRQALSEDVGDPMASQPGGQHLGDGDGERLLGGARHAEIIDGSWACGPIAER